MDYQIELWTVIFILGISQCLFFIFMLIFVPRGNKKANRYLLVLLLLFTLSLLDTSLFSLDLNSNYIYFIGVEWPNIFLFGPVIFLYIRSLLSSTDIYVSKLQLKHFIPYTLNLILYIPLYLLTPEEKITFFTTNSYYFIYKLLVFDLLDYISIIQIAIYLFLSLKLINNYHKNIKQVYSNIENINLQWAKYILFIFFILWSVFSVSTYIDDFINIDVEFEYILNFIITIMIYVLGFIGIRKSTIFIDNSLNLLNENSNSSNKLYPGNTNQEKYSRSTLTEEESIQILNKLNKFVIKENLFLDESLTLSTLSNLLKESPHKLSQVINEKMKMNFFDYINKYRIEYAKHQLCVVTDKIPKILTIAYDSGFSSKSAFYAAFKKWTNMTPLEFRKITVVSNKS